MLPYCVSDAAKVCSGKGGGALLVQVWLELHMARIALRCECRTWCLRNLQATSKCAINMGRKSVAVRDGETRKVLRD